jgi:ribosomal protein S18 acetylase RimI-like enzyme
MYRTWIRKSCQGYADKVLVTECNEQLSGFVTCHHQERTRGNIGLLGVSADQRGQRAGECLVKAALQWFVEQGVTDVSVVTQGRNLKAQRFYERLGFVTQSIQLWYHKWFLPEDAT